MSLEEKAAEVSSLFNRLDAEIAAFQGWSGLHCQWGCGKCCFKPDIEATILEFIPFALHLKHEKKAEEWLERLQESDASVCLILNTTQGGAGMCLQYPHRGLICRLFGYSARTNKYGQKEIITCQIIKTEQETSFRNAQQALNSGQTIPGMSDYYMQLRGIDFELTREVFPINLAIRKAIETVLQYYAYRDEVQ